MSAAENRQPVDDAFQALGRSDVRPLLDLMAEDCVWIIEGQTRFSRRISGKTAIKDDLLKSLFDAFATPYRFRIEELIAEGDRVVLLGRGQVTTRWGKDYNNSYCFVLRLVGGRLVELREYLDTALVESVFGAAERSAGQTAAATE